MISFYDSSQSSAPLAENAKDVVEPHGMENEHELLFEARKRKLEESFDGRPKAKILKTGVSDVTMNSSTL